MKRSLALLLAAAVLILAGCGGAPATQPTPTKKEQVARINIAADPKTLDPGLATGTVEATVNQHLYEGLMRIDAQGRYVPALAAATPEVKDNGLTYVFKLRDATWSNGDPIAAEDFVWSWKRTLDPFTASKYAYQLYYIKGGEALNSVKLKVKGADGKDVDRPEAEVKAEVKRLSDALGVKAIDKNTLEVKLEAPTPYFLAITAFHTLYPVNRKAVEAHPKDWFRNADTIVTSGPFKFKSWAAKDKVIVEKNPSYYDAAKVKLDRIEFYMVEADTTADTMFESGQLDASDNPASAELDRLKKDHPDELKILPDISTYFYRFNVTKPPLNDVRVRKALALAIDRKAIVDNVTKAGQVPATGMVPNGFPDASGDFRKNGGSYIKDADLDTAKKLLAEAGFPEGKGFPNLTVIYNTSDGHKKIAEAVQEMWKKNLGVLVNLQNQEWQVYLDSQSTLSYQISRAGWQADYVDPMTFMDMWVKDGGNNETGWSNAQYDQLIQQAKTTGDQTVRMKAMHDAEKILMDEMPIAPIYEYVRVRLISKHLKGWIYPLTTGINLREAYLE